jgi:hypothetical protein
MNTEALPRPSLLGARGTYPFRHEWYWLVVKKAVVRPTPRPRKDGRDLKIVFEAFRHGPDGRLVRCPEERLAQHVGLLFQDGAWRPPDSDDLELLKALGVLDGSLPDEDPADRLEGRWIKGLPGPRGRDGFNPLDDYQAVTASETEGLQPGPAAVSPNSPGGFARLVDTTPLHPGSPAVPGPSSPAGPPATGRAPLDPACRPDPCPHAAPGRPEPPRMSSEPGQIKEQVREALREFLEGASTGAPARPRKPSPRAEMAHASFKRAESDCGEGLSDKAAYYWLREHDPEEYELPDKLGTWARYLREARRYYGTGKYKRRARVPEPRSLVGPGGALLGSDGKRIIRKKPTP